MTFKNKLIAIIAALPLLTCTIPVNAVCAETHTVTVIDFNGNVMDTIQVPHGQAVDLKHIDVSKLDSHINDYTQVKFNSWSKYPDKITEDIVINALFVKMTIECPSVPAKTEYFSKKGNLRTDGLKVTITKYTQLPEKDEHGAFLVDTEVVNITDTCSIVPDSVETAFEKSDSASVHIFPPNSNRAIASYDITYFEGLGDINGDSSIDSTDASTVLKIYADTQTGNQLAMSEKQLLTCDVNRDNIIDASDSSDILGYYAIVSTSSEEINWDDIF